MLNFIFCSDPLQSSQVDDLFHAEVGAVEAAGSPWALIQFEPLVYHNDAEAATAQVPMLTAEALTIYRGWMLKPAHYKLLYEALWQKGWTLINDPAQYQHAHYLPETYPLLREHTPRTVWMETDIEVPMGDVMALMELFGKRPVIVRDYAKSQKFYWDEACYIPDALDQERVARVVKRFVELQAEDLNKGLVFREYIKLEPLGVQHAQTEQPLYKEFRTFWLDGEPLYSIPYWNAAWYDDLTPPLEEFRPLAQRLKSRFFTLDLAKKLNSDWMIMEVGDGQVSGLPQSSDIPAFYHQLMGALREASVLR